MNRMQPGISFDTINCGKLRVVHYKNALDITVRFIKTQTVRTVTAHQLRRGSVKDPMVASVGGIGFIGIGKHNSSHGYYPEWRDLIKHRKITANDARCNFQIFIGTRL